MALGDDQENLSFDDNEDMWTLVPSTRNNLRNVDDATRGILSTVS